MQKELNTNLIKEKLSEYGYNQSSISKELGVSREAVSQWLKNMSFPKPSKLLMLGKILNLKFNEITLQNDLSIPKIAFRKVGSAKTKEKHIQVARQMGFALRELTDFLPPEMMIKPPELKKPVNEYNYIQEIANLVRKKFNITEDKINFEDIITILNSFNTILIPQLLGTKEQHENALHIYLPDSQTTWVFINLDTNIFDFKFWLSHELGHILTPSLENKKAEDFADNFAGAFLFSSNFAEENYFKIISISGIYRRIDHITKISNKLIISPITVYKEINKFAKFRKLRSINLENQIYKATTNFTKKYKLISLYLFKVEKPNVEAYIKTVEEKYKTIFFKLLEGLYLAKGLTEGYIKTVMNLPVSDAKEIYKYIINGTK
ncbi:MAG: helix-turn-helix transcriptional regulator [Bacteroidetes bacterium]|nr:helix-turn-helix transcriptional regulator [Bacteroidota bacterium]MCH8941613.1 helix-turn-helix transcriptional regulator [Bacteroidota bacterium]